MKNSLLNINDAIKNMMLPCLNLAKKNGENTNVDCAKSITEIVSYFDPTGLAALAVSFMFN